MRQAKTDLCGPFAVVFELARRKPTRFVKGADELLSNGKLKKIGGGVIEAESDLRKRPVPATVAAVEWLYTATSITAVRKGVTGVPFDGANSRLDLAQLAVR